MGVFSTMEITRKDAIHEIQTRLETAPNEIIEHMLFALLSNEFLYNYDIVADYNSDWHIKYNTNGLL